MNEGRHPKPPRHAFVVMTFLAAFILPTVAFAEVQTFTATHTYVLGDHDSKEDARQRCLLETKRKILEQAGVYIESASEVKNFDLTKDKITSFTAAVMQVKDTKEAVSFQQGHMTLTLKLTAQVDLAEVRNQLAARQIDAGVREDVAVQKEMIKRLEAQLEAMQRQMQQAPGRAPIPPRLNLSTAEMQWLRTWAAQGHADAQSILGMLYNLGLGVPKDYATARYWLEKAAVQGDAVAQSKLGMMYFMGNGVPQDYPQAAYWSEKAAVQGIAEAQTALGGLYISGEGVSQDYVQARHWLEKAAAQGDENAQALLGALYASGRGVPQDYVQARQWYQKAAAQNHAGAQYHLGLLYLQGQGVPQDLVQAAKWFEKAAAQGHAMAQVGLGMLYELGHGVPQDFVREYMWVSLAAASSNGEAQELATNFLDRITPIMTPAQIAKGQRLTQQCQAQQFKSC